MSTLLLAFALMLCIVAVMAVGVAMGRKPIAGSCGGLAQLGGDGECEICGGNPNACDSAGATPSPKAPIAAYDVAGKRAPMGQDEP